MYCGYFDDLHKEYVITDPCTPVKWINYIGSLAFGGFIDHTGGALLCKGDPALNRITKYITQLPASDFRGETLYLRLREGGGYRLISPFYVPGLIPLMRFECRVGLGYSRWVTEAAGLRTEATIFVPQEESLAVRWVQVTNLGEQPVRVDAVPLVEYTHFDALKQLTNADWVPQTMQSRAVREPGGLVTLLQYAFMRKDSAVNFFTSNLAATSFETDRRLFLGQNEYGTWAQPLGLTSAELPCSEAARGDNIAALLLPLGDLQPGETRAFVTLLGQSASLEIAQSAIHKYRQIAAVEAALVDLNAAWAGRLARQQVHTPDPALDTMLNIHNPHQCEVTLQWSRYLSYYQLGYGERGIGFRDSSQDIMGALVVNPGRCRELLRLLLQVQKQDGSAMHQFNPLTMEGTMGDAAERDDRPRYYGDDALWSVLAVSAYLKETGDFAFLDEVLPFYEKDRTGLPRATGTVLEHMYQAVTFTREHTGAHGLPLLGFADWNDTINLAGGAESALIACLYGKALLELIDLAEFRGDRSTVGRLRRDYETMRERFESAAWDGAWYASYFDADGTPLGSHTNPAGQIYAYGQAWPVIAGFASPERGRMALDSLCSQLNTPKGIKLSAPGFTGYDPTKGGITTYPPGAKENGGIFLHVNPWVILAETILGNGEWAYEYYAQINPARKNEIIEEYECEPYVYPQNILGDEHPRFGLARNSWLSGTASWMLQVGAQAILGIQPAYQGLLVEPCIPAAWESFEITRNFRGACYHIRITNPKHVCRGVTALRLDGAECSGNRIPVLGGGEHWVEITLG
jgi:cellobiose phosphorylase